VRADDAFKARNALLAILKRYPHDLTVLSELRPILVDLSDFSLCATLFQDAFGHYQSLYPSGPPEVQVDTSADNAGSNPQCFGLIDVLVLADLYNTPNIEAYDQAVTAIRRGCRWLQGRGAQKYWDACEDDREYDPPGHFSRTGDIQPGGYDLDINARQRLGVARIKMGEFEEGKVSITFT
jgi:general transcription factor 3C polypeptide 3 (transcription factor C subunit 4)